MTKEDIARMAREAGWFEGQASDVCIACSRFGINRFAELVAAHEWEECAKFCDDQYVFYGFDHVFAAGIRARGEK
jgi:hypothetical protein